MTLKDRASESPSPPLRVTSATDLIPENADFGRADRDIAKNTSLLGKAVSSDDRNAPASRARYAGIRARERPLQH